MTFEGEPVMLLSICRIEQTGHRCLYVNQGLGTVGNFVFDTVATMLDAEFVLYVIVFMQ